MACRRGEGERKRHLCIWIHEFTHQHTPRRRLYKTPLLSSSLSSRRLQSRKSDSRKTRMFPFRRLQHTLRRSFSLSLSPRLRLSTSANPREAAAEIRRARLRTPKGAGTSTTAASAITKHRNRFLQISAGLVVLGGVTVAVLNQNEDSLSFYITPSQLHESPDVPQRYFESGRSFRLGGMVVPNSVVHNRRTAEVQFLVTDYGSQDIAVRYFGALPDLFREGQGVVIQGKLANAEGTHVEASEVLAKHDESYMPSYVADQIKENQREREGEGEREETVVARERKANKRRLSTIMGDMNSKST